MVKLNLVLLLPWVGHTLVIRQNALVQENPWQLGEVSPYQQSPWGLPPFLNDPVNNPYSYIPNKPPGYDIPVRPVAPMDRVNAAHPIILPPQILTPPIFKEGMVPTLEPPAARAELRDYADKNVRNIPQDQVGAWYPVQAPLDFVPGNMRPPNSGMDLINGGGMSRRDRKWFSESARREETRELFDSIISEFNSIDASEDGLLQWDEFKGFVMDTLGRTELSAGMLFDRLKRPTSADIERTRFINAAADGLSLELPPGLTAEKFDKDNFPVTLTHLKPVYAGMPLGFWSDWSVCPKGQVALGARLQSQPYDNSIDNNGIVAVGLVCGTPGTSLINVEGVSDISLLRSGLVEDHVLVSAPNSKYTDYNFCAEGTQISGVRLQSQPYQPHDDNSAFTNIQFECSKYGATEGMNLIFEDENSAYPPGIPPREDVEHRQQLVSSKSIEKPGPGQWSPILLRCGPEDAVCGVKTRFRKKVPYFDEMAVTDIEFLCCPAAPES